MGLKITEARAGGWVRLALSGDLDFGSGPTLDRRLLSLRAQGLPVRLSLSHLQFLDSSGINVLVRALQRSREGTWRFQIDPDAPPFILRRFDRIGIDRILGWQPSLSKSSSPRP